MPRVFRYLALILATLVFACSGELKPVDIESGDMCSFCKMAISEKRYAAEIITEDESVLKFDDIGCMLRYKKGNASLKPLVIYVADSETKQWLKADDAFFVRSATEKTPMASGIIAFATAEKAGSAAVRFAELDR